MHQVYFTLARFKSLFVLWFSGLASEASMSLAGILGPVYLYNEMIHKSSEGIGSYVCTETRNCSVWAIPVA